MQYLRIPIRRTAVVVNFDMCSSTHILEELTLASRLSRLEDLLIKLKEHLAFTQRRVPFEAYKFTGDGWILLFPEATDGEALFRVLQDLCTVFHEEFHRLVLPHLSAPLPSTGLTFGLDIGPLARLTMDDHAEYIGRAINVACRLQSAIKDRDSSPAYKALVTNAVYTTYFAFAPGRVQVLRVRRRLRNIRGGEDFHCRKIHLLDVDGPSAHARCRVLAFRAKARH